MPVDDAEAYADSAEAELCTRDFGYFFQRAWRIIEPRYPLVWSWSDELVAEYLWLIREGKFHEYHPGAAGIILNVPRRTGKSSKATICFPVWCWLQDPGQRFMCGSYSANLSLEHSVKRRDLIQSEWFQRLFGDRFKLKSDVNRQSEFSNDKTGVMFATSVGGTLVGKGGDRIILDDPLNPTQAASDLERKSANDWIENNVRLSLNNQSTGVIVLVMQRLHEQDPTGYLLEKEPERWVHLPIAMEAEEDEEWHFPVSGRVVRRKAGDILEPERFPAAVVTTMKANRLTWAGQCQQRPAPLEGNLIKRSDVRYYGGRDPLTGEMDHKLPESFDLVLISADCAFKDLKTSDFVAVGAIGVKGPDRYVLNVVNAHLDEPATELEIERQRALYRANVTLIEDKANGSAVIKALERRCTGIVAISPMDGKASRLMAVCGEWQAGNWHVDRNAAWVETLIGQLISFPNAAHDDVVDMLSQTGVWLQNNSAEPRIRSLA